jgi:hypothetical protein
MDEGEPSLLRIVVSAQLNKKSGTYDGQIVVDMGGNQLMLHSGPGALHDCHRITVELGRGSGKPTARGRKNLMSKMQRRKEK